MEEEVGMTSSARDEGTEESVDQGGQFILDQLGLIDLLRCFSLSLIRMTMTLSDSHVIHKAIDEI